MPTTNFILWIFLFPTVTAMVIRGVIKWKVRSGNYRRPSTGVDTISIIIILLTWISIGIILY